MGNRLWILRRLAEGRRNSTSLSDIQLIGRTVSRVDAALIQYIEQRRMRLLYGCGGDIGSDALNMSVRATRAGDTTVSEARFFAPEWEDHG
ncbi:hypothetical protein [Streptomyces sp. NPDC054952]